MATSLYRARCAPLKKPPEPFALGWLFLPIPFANSSSFAVGGDLSNWLTNVFGIAKILIGQIPGIRIFNEKVRHARDTQ